VQAAVTSEHFLKLELFCVSLKASIHGRRSQIAQAAVLNSNVKGIYLIFLWVGIRVLQDTCTESRFLQNVLKVCIFFRIYNQK